FHFDIIFPDQNDELERSHLPETEFGRWAHVLLQFERVLAEEDQGEVKASEKACKGEHKDDELWRADLWDECRHHRSLRHTAEMMTEAIQQRGIAPKREVLVEEVSERACALYKLLWSA